MILGNAVLAIALITIGANREGFFSVGDIIFPCAVAALLAVRSLDVLKLHGLTASGHPATPGHLKRYIALLLAVSLALWGLAHAASHLAR